MVVERNLGVWCGQHLSSEISGVRVVQSIWFRQPVRLHDRRRLLRQAGLTRTERVGTGVIGPSVLSTFTNGVFSFFNTMPAVFISRRLVFLY